MFITSRNLTLFSYILLEVSSVITVYHVNKNQILLEVVKVCKTLQILLVTLTLSNSMHLFFWTLLSFLSSLVLSQNHLNKTLFQALVSSESIYCFVNLKFISIYNLKTSTILLIALYLFDDSSNNIISEIVIILVIFLYITLDFYITSLNSFCFLVLKYNQLTKHNLLIDLINRLMNFCLSLQENLTPLCIAANTPLAIPSIFNDSLYSPNTAVSILLYKTFVFTSEQPNITIIDTVAFLHISKLLGPSKFQICLYFLDIQTSSISLAESTPNLTNISSKYYKLTNIFSKSKAEVLIPHYLYDFKINLEEITQSLVSTIYSLSVFKQKALKKFIEKNLNIDFI